MSYEFYKIIHVWSVFILLMALMGMLLLKHLGNPNAGMKKIMAIGHGVSLILVLVAGMGLVARLGNHFEPWVIGKIVLWVGLGMATLSVRFMPFFASLALIFVMAGGAAFLAIMKPF